MHDLRKSEQKVGEYVLKHAEEVIHMRIVDLATESQVSEPTIVRFCRAIGFDSFQAFKLTLAQQLVRREVKVPFAMDDQDSPKEMGLKLISNTMRCLEQTRAQLKWASVEQAIERISSSRRVEFYGSGASGIVAADAHQKFFRLELATQAYADADMQTMSAATMTKQDTVVAISHSGRTLSLLESIKVARINHAVVIAICPPNTPLANEADITIALDIDEDNETFAPMNSRLMHLIVLDMLATGVYLNRGSDFDAHLINIQNSILPLKTPLDPQA